MTELPTDAEAADLDKTPAPAKGISGAGKPPSDLPGPGPEDDDPFAATRSKTIGDREDEYRAQRRRRMLSPDRADPFAADTPAADLTTYKDVMVGQQLDKEHAEVRRAIAKQKEEEAKAQLAGGAAADGEKKKR